MSKVVYLSYMITVSMYILHDLNY